MCELACVKLLRAGSLAHQTRKRPWYRMFGNSPVSVHFRTAKSTQPLPTAIHSWAPSVRSSSCKEAHKHEPRSAPIAYRTVMVLVVGSESCKETGRAAGISFTMVKGAIDNAWQ